MHGWLALVVGVVLVLVAAALLVLCGLSFYRTRHICNRCRGRSSYSPPPPSDSSSSTSLSPSSSTTSLPTGCCIDGATGPPGPAGSATNTGGTGVPGGTGATGA